MYVVQIWSANYISSYGIMIGTIVILCLLVVLNIIFFIIYYASVVKDNTFKYWKSKYRKSSTCIAITSLILNFKFFRCLYS